MDIFKWTVAKHAIWMVKREFVTSLMDKIVRAVVRVIALSTLTSTVNQRDRKDSQRTCRFRCARLEEWISKESRCLSTYVTRSQSIFNTAVSGLWTFTSSVRYNFKKKERTPWIRTIQRQRQFVHFDGFSWNWSALTVWRFRVASKKII